MRLSVSVSAILLATAAPAVAQRSDENAVKAAGDAFGTSVGNEKIGLYSASDVRGFSPVQAGNIRVDGLSVTDHGGFSSRIVSGSTIRVGLTAQGYPFPAPTGIVDYSPRSSGSEAVLSPVLYLGPYGTKGADLDMQIPLLGDRLGLAGGVSYRYEENFPGEDGRIMQAGGVLWWKPSAAVEVKSFLARIQIRDDVDVPSIFVAGPYQPPKIGRRYFGLDWATGDFDQQIYGALGSIRLSDAWHVRAGLFRASSDVKNDFTELYRNVQPDGSAARTLVAVRNQTAASTSGELRSSYSLTESARQHTVHLAVRGRNTGRLYGGADARDQGPGAIGAGSDAPEPSFDFDPLSRDDVRQLTGGFGYELRWPDVLELSLGLQKTNYEKTSRIPDRPALSTRDNPWLHNGTLAVYLTDTLVAYAGYTRGLEESGAAPANAVNRNSAPPALRTSQRDAGLRYAITPSLRLVAGLFDVRKPYFNVDAELFYRQLGTVRHRGLELSLAGEPVQGLRLVAGAAFLDADVSGEAVDLGIIGPRPVGTTSRLVRANLDYRLPFSDALSVDLGLTNQAGQVASGLQYAELGGRQLTTVPRTIVDVGARYRFKAGEARATLRGQITNLFDVYAWKVGSNAAFRFIDARRFMLSLAADI